MRPLTTLTVQAGAQVTASDLRYNDGWVWLNNETSYTLTIITPLGPQTLPSEWGGLYPLKGPAGAPSLILTASPVVPFVGPALTSVTGTIYLETEGGVLPPPGPVPLARHEAMGSQARSIVVPITSKQNFVGDMSGADGTTMQFGLSTLQPNMIAASSFVAYIYSCQLMLAAFTANTTNHVIVLVEMYPGDNSFNPIGGFTPIVYIRTHLFALWNTTNFTLYNTQYNFSPAQPLQGGASQWSGSPTTACIRLRVALVSGSGMTVSYQLAADVDLNNATDSPGAIGHPTSVGSQGAPNNTDIF